MKRITSLLLSLLLMLSLCSCGSDEMIGATIVTTPAASSAPVEKAPDDAVPAVPETPVQSEPTEEYMEAAPIPVEEGEYYYDLENVILYLEVFGCLPDNYITKKEARQLGWEGGSVERYLEGAAIGGDYFGNREGILPEGDYTECDLYTDGESSRGAYRLVFSDEGYYYTEDHYESFTEYTVTEDFEVVEVW